MIKILLCCASGMSTSLLVEKMKRAATKQNVDAEIWAVNAENTDLKDVEADIIFLGHPSAHDYTTFLPVYQIIL